MLQRRVAWVVLALLLAAVGFVTRAPVDAADTYALTGRVVRVADGDTLTLQIQGAPQSRIRLASIDAPEIGHGKKRPGQPYGQASRQALAALVAGHQVTLRCYERDHYGRDVCDVPLPDGRTANQVMVATGMAWANQQNGGKYLRDRQLLDLERTARAQHLGLWRDARAVAPWDWRRDCWRALESGRGTPTC